MRSRVIIPKICLALMLFNLYVFTVVFKKTIPHCTQITTLAALANIIFFSLGDRKMTNTAYRDLYPLVGYAVFVLFTGALLGLYANYPIEKTFGLFELLVFAIIICYVCYIERSYEYIYLLSVFIAVIDAVYAIVTNQNLNTRMVLANNVSENVAGLLFTVGVIGSYLSKSKFMNRYIKLFVNLILLTGMVLTGSRQAVLLSAIVYLNWIFPSIKGRFIGGKFRIADLVFSVVIVALVITLLNSSIISDFQQTKFYARIIGENASTVTSDAQRGNLYRMGIEDMKSSPIWGVGYKNTTSYTHSTYMEVLGGTGFLGALLFFLPLIKKFLLYVRNIRSALSEEEKKHCKDKLLIMIVLFVMMLFRAIHYYMPSMIILVIGITSFDKTDELVEEYTGIVRETYEDWTNPKL